jgi:serine/threonine-protein kinase
MERFVRESRALSRIDHPNIVKIFEVGRDGRDSFIAMEYLAEGSLDRLLVEGSQLSEETVVALLLDVARGLEAALNAGILHRDVKPRNVFLGSGGGAKLGDFGLARLTDETTMTTEGRVFGTPAYLSPEAVLGQRVTWKADQYSLGIAAWELLVGRRPFRAPTLHGAAYQHLHRPLPALEECRPGVSRTLVEIVERMAAKRPEARFDSYGELMLALSSTRTRTA